LSAAALTQVAFYGGAPEIQANAYVRMPVASIFPTVTGGTAGGQWNCWANAVEIMTDAPVVEFCVYTTNTKKTMFQVDGQYVDFVGSTGLGAGAADTYFKLTFATRKVRRIRMLLATVPASGPSLFKQIRVSATCSFWKPAMSKVMRVAWAGDSYGEGQNGAGTIYAVPNSAYPVVTCELLGLRDCRQVSVGACGYISTNGGLRSALRDQIPRWANQGPFDLIVFANGYNDAGNDPAVIQAEVLYCLRLARSLYPTTPIVVLGCQAGSGGPNANQIACDAAIGAAVTQFDDAICKFVPVSVSATNNWLNGTGYIGAANGSGNSDVYIDPDKVHPALPGAEFIGFRAAAGIRKAVASMCV
jgi:hypothetical protein